jgi:hypothetical protein
LRETRREVGDLGTGFGGHIVHAGRNAGVLAGEPADHPGMI